MSHQLLLASQNAGKQRELQTILGDLDIEIILPKQADLEEFDVDETGSTFEENARLKAYAFAQASQMLTLADDSGLEVLALGGIPGVYSKRFGSDDADRHAKLLKLLLESGQADRSAQFRSVLCFYNPMTQIEHLVEGVVEGSIAEVPRGTNGFGYDPLFIPTGHTHTFAELPAETKNQISHRGRAAIALKHWLSTHPQW